MKRLVGYGCGRIGFRPLGQAVGSSGPSVPGALTGLNAVFNDPDVDLTWNASSGADSYRIERSAAGAGSWSTLEAAEATTAYTDEAPGDGLFDYRVTPVNGAGDGTAAIAEDVATAAAGDLQGLAVTFDADSGNLSWTAATRAASYKVERRDSDVGSGAGSYSTLAAAHTTNSYEDATISGSTSAFDTAYDYRVTPQNSHTNGAAQESIYTKYIADANPTTWPAFTGVEYKVWAAGGGGGGGKDDINGGGGGGGGGYVGSTSFSFVGGSASVIIGAGGAAGIAGSDGGAGGESYCSELGVTSGSVAAGFGGDSDGTGGVGGVGGANGESSVALVGGAGGAAGGSGGAGGAGGDEIGVPGENGQIPGGGGGGGGGENPDNGGAGARGELRIRYITPPTA